MISDVREYTERVPFAPFSIRTSDGHECSVPTEDHIFITPRGNRSLVIADDGAVAIPGPLHLNGIIEQPNGQ